MEKEKKANKKKMKELDDPLKLSFSPKTPKPQNPKTPKSRVIIINDQYSGLPEREGSHE